jgi:hypothetical protein
VDPLFIGGALPLTEADLDVLVLELAAISSSLCLVSMGSWLLPLILRTTPLLVLRPSTTVTLDTFLLLPPMGWTPWGLAVWPAPPLVLMSK